MQTSQPKKILLRSIVIQALSAFKNKPVLFMPFGIFAAFEFLALFFIYIAPRHPFIKVLGPPIERFFSPMYLHYPTNFIVMPVLLSHARTFISIFVGPLTAVLAVYLTFLVYQKKQPKLSSAAKASLKKYAGVFLVLLLTTFLYHLSKKGLILGLQKYFVAGHKQLFFLKPQVWLGPVYVALVMLIGVLIQGLFLYAVPYLVIDNEKLFQAIGKGMVLFRRLFLKTFLLILLPILLYIPVIILQYNTPVLIDKIFPESVLLVCILAVIMATLVIDAFITVSTTFLFLKNKEQA